MLFELLFPKRCLWDGAEGHWLCQRAWENLPWLLVSTCPGCPRLTHSGAYCKKHRRGKDLSGIAASCRYEGSVKAAIGLFKYQGVRDLTDPLCQILAAAPALYLPKTALVVPVPLHRVRQRQRGFNQSRFLAQGLAQLKGLTLQDNLIKTRRTPPQVELKKLERLENVGESFRWQGEQLAGKTVALVDDVATTGATLEAAAKALKVAGARRVLGVVVARD